ncbi:bifunctional glutamate N-acetyltransferase/amino-acid acetyltransferase ArgJ [Tropicimonas aquimaris]|uniref:Arginine biosynthesis bifunctional protein ArgJ n=1 Tax=Tropicimonas aquimaris TaxID=914152 RepID=A0ABW3IVY4_9RHOB
MAGSLPVSPLAPARFPDLPVVAGVEFAAVAAGVRYPGRTDVMLARLAPGSTVAGVFTRSATRSAPVLDCQAKLSVESAGTTGAAILVNSGNSNAFTGSAGEGSVQAICEAVSAAAGVPQERVFTSSTGVIGERLPHDRITAKVGELVSALAADGIEKAARAIMTTDTFPKGAEAIVETSAGPVRIAGIAKGSGMIAPDMATMLVYIFTDAAVPQPVLQSMLSGLTDVTFNAITVDSDTSTSDTLLLAATGQSGAAITKADSADGRAFSEALHGVMLDLAKQVVRDGEGASKFVEVQVTGAVSDADAKKVAMAIANSPLIKTAIAGEDPNWGRVVMAVGKSGAEADRDRLSIRFGDILVAENGWVAGSYNEAAGATYMKQAELVIGVDLGLGSGSFTAWTCDLTHGYISINADYRS